MQLYFWLTDFISAPTVKLQQCAELSNKRFSIFLSLFVGLEIA